MRARLEERRQANALRDVLPPTPLIDFSSNDYLGLARGGGIGRSGGGAAVWPFDGWGCASWGFTRGS